MLQIFQDASHKNLLKVDSPQSFNHFPFARVTNYFICKFSKSVLVYLILFWNAYAQNGIQYQLPYSK